MAALHGYLLIEAMPSHYIMYSLRACVHDRVLYLIGKIFIALSGLAVHYVAQIVA